VYFIDTRSLAKRYIAEVGSAWIRSWIAPQYGHTIIISELCKVEMFSIFARLERETILTSAVAEQYRFQFLVHAQTEYLVIPVDIHILRDARRLIIKHTAHKLRTLDAIQLASALKSRSIIKQSITFISSDTRLSAAAASEEFPIDDPNLHS
jgi:uncharacterized protein